MKTIKYLAAILIIIVGVNSCKLYDNIDPKNPTEVPVSTLYTNAQIALINQVDEVSVNWNISRLIAQYWQETTYFNESRYDFQDRSIPDSYYEIFYRNVLMDFKEAKEIYNSEDYGGDLAERDNIVKIIDIQEVYAWHCLVDAFGDVPYSEALLGADNPTPVYDDAETIYLDLIARLKSDLAGIDLGVGSFGVEDIMYGGDVALWKKFGASLLLRLGMRMADVDNAVAQDAVETAVAAGVFADQSESGIFYYIGVVPHVNNIYEAFTIDGRKDYLPTNTIVDMMKNLEDPRIDDWFTQYEGEYVGAILGLDGAQSYNNYSNFTDRFMAASFEAIIIDFVEVSFLLAEAAERGYGVSGTAEDHYNNAIAASILYWDGTQDDVDAYLANPDVAYSTAAGDWKQKIGTQKWLALYNRGVEAWAEWRRLDYPEWNVPEGMTYDDIPRRMPYPFAAGELNGSNYEAASQAIGGDLTSTKIFWDVNDPSF